MSKNKKRFIVFLMVASGAALMLWSAARLGSDSVGPDLAGDHSVHVTDGGAAQARKVPEFLTGLEELPASLRGTSVDGELSVDAKGNLKITLGVRQLFDYFFSAVGEESREVVLARITAYIKSRLSDHPAALQQALSLLQQYVSLLDAMATPPAYLADQAKDGGIEGLRARMTWVQQTRRQFLDPVTVEAFFSDEEAYDLYSLERMAVMQDKSLGATDKANRLAALETALPAAVRENVQAVSKYQELTALTEDWQSRKGSPAELRAIREKVVGAEAADRLESLDKERAVWQGRVDSYLEQRSRIMVNPGLSEQDRQQAVISLRKSLFSGAELIRVETLEKMRDTSGSAKPS